MENKFQKTLWVKIGVLTLVTVGSFAYLLQSLEPSNAGSAGENNQQAGKAPVKGVELLSTDGADKQKEPASPNAVPNAAAANADRVNLAFVGDVMFSDNVEGILKQNGYDYPYKFVKPYLEKADFAVANLETPITARGTAQVKEYTYRSSPAALPKLKKAGVGLVNLANNHSMDFGEEGLLDTMDNLDAQGILRVGAGRNTEEAYKYALVEKNGFKIAFLGFSRVIPDTSWYSGKSKPGLAETYSTKLPLEAIDKAKADADMVVVIAHWGEERKDVPGREQTRLAHLYIDEGADLVVASHPHVLQGFEQYKGKWIAYSLGNFIFTTNDIPATWESMILQASCTKQKACDLSVVPIVTKGAQPVRMPDEDAPKLFSKLSRISYNADVDKDGKVTVGPERPFQQDAQEPLKAVPPVTDKKPASGITASPGGKGTGTSPAKDKNGTDAAKDKKTGEASGKEKTPASGNGSAKPPADGAKKSETSAGSKTHEKTADPAKKNGEAP
ncbi:CapA family protein [Paenibacillus filicis]|uniref:CapA family protein n=1 Tax=Paenibacillus gyeongsangnamensis TaxID=3388067 RepID=A0ABT4Q591_9BACL|nr:CapA family protein [Paenibacillus filicis]MCZ8512049.1 CapA family protein [Paenibacillus filicis]